MSAWFEPLLRWTRRVMVSLAALLLVLVPLSLGTALAASQTFYLKSTGVPISFLSETYPTATDLDNYDWWRDSEPGILLQRSSNESNETDPDKYQLWMAAATGADIRGDVTLSFWSAMKDFDADNKGSVRVQLLDCDLFLTDCHVIGATVEQGHPWSEGSTDWVQKTVVFSLIEHTIPADRSLAVKLVVRDVSEDDMWFAYNTTAHPSSLTIETGALPPTTTSTTTSTTTTTTTLPPPTTTTTTTPPPATTTTTTTTLPPTTTTTLPPTTTTTQPIFGTTTTTTLPPPTWPPAPTTTTTTTRTPATTTTTTPPATTAAPTTSTTLPTTTSTPPIEPPVPETDDTEPEDVAMAALPQAGDINRGGPRPGGTLSSALIDGLALIVPPGVAAAILSPLLLLEALVATFAATGRELAVPLATLVIGVAWIGGRWRRDRSPVFVPWYEKAGHE